MTGSISLLPNGLEDVLDASQTRKMHPDIREVIDDFLINAKMRKLRVKFINMPETLIVDHVTYIHQLANDKVQQRSRNDDNKGNQEIL